MSSYPLPAFIEADIDLLPPERSGRLSPLENGYRCNCNIGNTEDGVRVFNDASFYLIDSLQLAPGERGRARVRPRFPDAWSRLTAGSTFELCEGRRVVGVATVTGVFPPL